MAGPGWAPGPQRRRKRSACLAPSLIRCMHAGGLQETACGPVTGREQASAQCIECAPGLARLGPRTAGARNVPRRGLQACPASRQRCHPCSPETLWITLCHDGPTPLLCTAPQARYLGQASANAASNSTCVMSLWLGAPHPHPPSVPGAGAGGHDGGPRVGADADGGQRPGRQVGCARRRVCLLRQPGEMAAGPKGAQGTCMDTGGYRCGRSSCPGPQEHAGTSSAVLRSKACPSACLHSGSLCAYRPACAASL